MSEQVMTQKSDRKVKFSIGALFLSFYVLFDVVLEIYYATVGHGRFGFVKVIEWLAVIAVAVVFFMKKRGLANIIPLGILAFWSLIESINGSVISDATLWGVDLNIVILADFCLLLAVILISLSDMIGFLKKFKKIFWIAFYVSFVLALAMFFISRAKNGMDDSDYVRIILMNAYTVVFYDIGILLVALWVSNPFKKEIPVGANSTAGEVGKEFFISRPKQVCLLFFTGYIWMYIWTYKATEFTNKACCEYRNPRNALLLCMFVPFYMIIWTHKTASMIDKIAKDKGIVSDIATPCLLLSIFMGIIPPIIMQEKINEIVTAK